MGSFSVEVPGLALTAKMCPYRPLTFKKAVDNQAFS